MTDAFVDFLACNFNGISIAVLIALVLGVIVACNEGIKYKFRQYVETEGDGTEVFQKKYLISGVVAIILCFATVWVVFSYNGGVCSNISTDIWGEIETMIVTFTAVLTEALVLIKLCNRRLDTMFLGDDAGASGDKVTVKEETSTKISELKIKL